MSVTRVLSYLIFSTVAIAATAAIAPRVIVDEPSFFSRTIDYVTLESNQHGYRFMVPSTELLTVASFPNVDKLSAEDWAAKKYEGSIIDRITTPTAEYVTVTDATKMVLMNNGNAMLELIFDDSDSQVIADVLDSRQIVARTEPVAFEPTDWATPFNGTVYRNAIVGDAVKISGDETADNVIRSIGEERGYQPRFIIEDPSELVFIDGYPTRPVVAAAWKELDAVARADGIDMFVASGYRDQTEQVAIFRAEYANEAFIRGGLGFSASEIQSELGREVVNEVLKTVAVPGYSKHHTGWTLDVTEVGVNLFAFDSSDAFEWMSANNYENARRFGFIPSYPEGGPSQGPEPEAWEYVYVGEDYLGY